MRNFITLITIMGLSACASVNSTKSFSQAPDKNHGVVRITRESSFIYSLGTARVRIDDQEAAMLNNGDLFETKLPIGEHKISVDAPTAPGTTTVNLKVQPKIHNLLITPRGTTVVSGIGGGLIGNMVEAGESGKGSYDLIEVQ